MKVSTLAYWSDLMLRKMVLRKIRATGKNLRALDFSRPSHLIYPRAWAVLTTRAVPASWENRTKDGAASLWTAYLLLMRRVAEQSM